MPSGYPRSAIALVAIFLPVYCWSNEAALFGTNCETDKPCKPPCAARTPPVVGILGWLSTIDLEKRRFSPRKTSRWPSGGFQLLTAWKAPPWIVVILLAGNCNSSGSRRTLEEAALAHFRLPTLGFDALRFPATNDCYLRGTAAHAVIPNLIGGRRIERISIVRPLHRSRGTSNKHQVPDRPETVAHAAVGLGEPRHGFRRLNRPVS